MFSPTTPVPDSADPSATRLRPLPWRPRTSCDEANSGGNRPRQGRNSPSTPPCRVPQVLASDGGSLSIFFNISFGVIGHGTISRFRLPVRSQKGFLAVARGQPEQEPNVRTLWHGPQKTGEKGNLHYQRTGPLSQPFWDLIIF